MTITKILVAGATLVALGLAAGPAIGGPPALDRWSLTIQGAPQIPQDVWISALGSKAGGWNSGGSICLGPLAQGFEIGQHVTLLTEVTAAGITGPDGTPVAEGDDVAPGIELPDRDFEVVYGRTYFVKVDGYVVNSNVADFPAGATLPLMFTFDASPGYQVQPLVLWFQDPQSGDYFPFLNEGLMMTNVRRVH